MASYDTVRKAALSLAGIEESTSYGTAALKVRGKLLVRLKEDNESFGLRLTWEERERVLALYPEQFFLTEHYRKGPWVLLRLKTASAAQIRAALSHAWQQTAPKSLTQTKNPAARQSAA